HLIDDTVGVAHEVGFDTDLTGRIIEPKGTEPVDAGLATPIEGRPRQPIPQQFDFGRRQLGVVQESHAVDTSGGSERTNDDLGGFTPAFRGSNHPSRRPRRFYANASATSATSDGTHWHSDPTTPAPRGRLMAIRSEANRAMPARNMNEHV